MLALQMLLLLLVQIPFIREKPVLPGYTCGLGYQHAYPDVAYYN
jgi:hypothetical protein